jgi:hypothetical protein
VSLCRALDEDSYNYMQQCPLILEIEDLGIYVVHAGLLPNKPLYKQKPFDIMNMVSAHYCILGIIA